MPPTPWRCARCRSSIEVRDGAVEESERSEGDDLGLRVLVGRRQAVVSTNDIAATAPPRSPNARWPWRARRPRTSLPASPIAALLARDIPDLDLIDPDIADGRANSKRRRAQPKQAALSVKGVSKSGGASASAGIGGMVLVTSHGFRGAYLGSQPRRRR